MLARLRAGLIAAAAMDVCFVVSAAAWSGNELTLLQAAAFLLTREDPTRFGADGENKITLPDKSMVVFRVQGKECVFEARTSGPPYYGATLDLNKIGENFARQRDGSLFFFGEPDQLCEGEIPEKMIGSRSLRYPDCKALKVYGHASQYERDKVFEVLKSVFAKFCKPAKSFTNR